MSTRLVARSRAIAAVLVAVAAVAIRLGATADWQRGHAPDGARVSLSPIGLAKTLGAAGDRSCRWWPEDGGDASLCAQAPNGAIAFARTRAAYPLLSVALWTSVVSLFLQVLRIPRRTGIRVAVTWLVAFLTAAALAIMLLEAPRALAALDRARVAPGAPGFWLACTALACSGVSGVLQLASRANHRGD